MISYDGLYEFYTVNATKVIEPWLVHYFYSKPYPTVYNQHPPLADQLALQLVALHKKK